MGGIAAHSADYQAIVWESTKMCLCEDDVISQLNIVFGMSLLVLTGKINTPSYEAT